MQATVRCNKCIELKEDLRSDENLTSHILVLGIGQDHFYLDFEEEI